MTLPRKSPTFSVTTNSKGHLPDGTWSGTMYFVIRGHLQSHKWPQVAAGASDRPNLPSDRKWPHVTAEGKWPQVTASGRRGQVAASGRRGQVAASGRRGQVAASDRKWPQRASGRKWPLLASGREWPRVAASGRFRQVAASGCKWPPFPISNSTPNATPLESSLVWDSKVAVK